ncbi:hypothetical protein Q3G72_017479 [Acer saccharum]|nr:hypothetical protein Q3G72_017479 [Acer saccharum]
MDAETEDMDEGDDELDQIPTWAEQLMFKIMQSNVVSTESNRKLAAKVRGLNEVIAWMIRYQIGGPSEYTDEQSQYARPDQCSWTTPAQQLRLADPPQQQQ